MLVYGPGSVGGPQDHAFFFTNYVLFVKPETYINPSNTNLRRSKIFFNVSRFTRNPHSLIWLKTTAIALIINKKQKKLTMKCFCQEPDPTRSRQHRCDSNIFINFRQNFNPKLSKRDFGSHRKSSFMEQVSKKCTSEK